MGGGSTNEIMRCIHIGLLCVQENEEDRPTMASIVLMLNSYSLSLPLPSEPAFFMNSTTNGGLPLEPEDNSSTTKSNHSQSTKSNHSQSNESPNFSRNEASISDLFPR